MNNPNFTFSHRNTHNCPEYSHNETTTKTTSAPAPKTVESIKYPAVKSGPGEAMRRKVAAMRHKSLLMNEYGGNAVCVFIKTPDGSIYPICVQPSRTVNHCTQDILKQCNLGPDVRSVRKYLL